MNDKEAIDILKNCIADYVIGEYCSKCGDFKICESKNEDCYFQQAIDKVLNLIENQKAEIEDLKLKIQTQKELLKMKTREIEKKDEIIDLMIKVMIDSSICDYFIKQNCKHYAGENKKLCDVCIKEYFERKVENETSI